jgi:transcriptional regulator with XRE-family HTH domain
MKKNNQLMVNDRIAEIIKYYGLNANSFSKKIGLTNNVTIGNIISGRKNSPSFDTLERIVKICPEINPTWLLSGEGEMVKNIIQDNVNGDNIQGHSVTINKSEIDKFLELLKSKDEQINRLLGILEKSK